MNNLILPRPYTSSRAWLNAVPPIPPKGQSQGAEAAERGGEVRLVDKRSGLPWPEVLPPLLQTDGTPENLEEMAVAGGPGPGVGVYFAVFHDVEAMAMTVAENHDIEALG